MGAADSRFSRFLAALRGNWLAVVSGLALFALVLCLNPTAWVGKDLKGEDYVRLLGALFFVALVLERALEVYVGVLHAPKTERLRHDLARQQDALDFKAAEREQTRETADADIKVLTEVLNRCADVTRQPDPQTAQWCRATIDELKNRRDQRLRELDAEAANPLHKHDELRQALLEQSIHTRLSVIKWSTICGLTISALGLRTLVPLIAPASLADMPMCQLRLLTAADIAVTGGLLAGGSEGIHKLMQAITGFFDAIAASSRAKVRD